MNLSPLETTERRTAPESPASILPGTPTGGSRRAEVRGAHQSPRPGGSPELAGPGAPASRPGEREAPHLGVGVQARVGRRDYAKKLLKNKRAREKTTPRLGRRKRSVASPPGPSGQDGGQAAARRAIPAFSEAATDCSFRVAAHPAQNGPTGDCPGRLAPHRRPVSQRNPGERHEPGPRTPAGRYPRACAERPGRWNPPRPGIPRGCGVSPHALREPGILRGEDGRGGDGALGCTPRGLSRGPCGSAEVSSQPSPTNARWLFLPWAWGRPNNAFALIGSGCSVSAPTEAQGQSSESLRPDPRDTEHSMPAGGQRRGLPQGSHLCWLLCVFTLKLW